MRNSEDKITEGIDLYFSNLSSRKVRNHFRRHRGRNSSHVTILDWCRKYTLKVQKYLDKLTPQLSGQYYADETEIDCEGRKDIFWVSIDWGTRYINAVHYSPVGQNNQDALLFLEKIKQSGKPKYIQTDAAPFYPKTFKKVFFKNTEKLTERTRHIINNYSKTGKHNVRIETVFMKIKDRVYDFRGLKALWSAPILLNGIILQHNLIEAHTTTGKVPCELANIKSIKGDNRWLELIKQSSQMS